MWYFYRWKCLGKKKISKSGSIQLAVNYSNIAYTELALEPNKYNKNIIYLVSWTNAIAKPHNHTLCASYQKTKLVKNKTKLKRL